MDTSTRREGPDLPMQSSQHYVGKPFDHVPKQAVLPPGDSEIPNASGHETPPVDIATIREAIIEQVEKLLAVSPVQVPEDKFRILSLVYEIIYETQASDASTVPEAMVLVANHISLQPYTVRQWMWSEIGYLIQICKNTWDHTKVVEKPLHSLTKSNHPLELMDQIGILRDAFCRSPTLPAFKIQELVLATNLKHHSIVAWHHNQNTVYDRQKKRQAAQDTDNMNRGSKRKHSSQPTTPVPLTTDVGEETCNTKSNSLQSRRRAGRQLPTPSMSSGTKRVTTEDLSTPAAKRRARPMFCPSCNKDYPLKSSWKDHQRRGHFPPRIWKCWLFDQACDKSKVYHRSDMVRNHLKAVHERDANEELEQEIQENGRATVSLFHNVCGFSGCHEKFGSLEESLNHIGNEIESGSLREDWTDRCTNNHEKRWHSYTGDGEEIVPDRDDDDHNGGNGDGNGNGLPGQQDEDYPGFFGIDNLGHFGTYGDTGNGFYGGSLYGNSGGYQQYSQDLQRLPSPEGATSVLKTLQSDEVISTRGPKTVQRWKDSTTSRTYVKKSIQRSQILIEDDEATSDFCNWLSRSKGLEHKHIINVREAFLSDEDFVVISSPVVKLNLAVCLASKHIEVHKTARDVREQLLSWIVCLKSGLEYLHRSYVTHHDIKPSNILLHEDSQIIITDFVNAKHLLSEMGLDSEAVEEQTRYHAPEVTALGKRSRESDIFSLGCVFAEILTRAFGESIEAFEEHRGKKYREIAFAETSDSARSWVELLLAQSPVEVQADEALQAGFGTVLRMLAEKPEDRPKVDQLDLPFRSLCDCSGYVEHADCSDFEKGIMAPPDTAWDSYIHSPNTDSTLNAFHKYQSQHIMASNITVDSNLSSVDDFQSAPLSYSQPTQPHLHPPRIRIDSEHITGDKSLVSGSLSPAAVMKSNAGFLVPPLDSTRYGGVFSQAGNLTVPSPSREYSIDWSETDFMDQNGLYDESPSAVPSLSYSTPDNGSVHPMTPGDRINLGSHASKKNKLFSSSTAAIASNVSPPSKFCEPDDMEAGGLLDDGFLLD